MSNLSPIAQPLADKKLKKRVLKLSKKAAKEKNVRRGVKEVVKALRKEERGVCLLAGDITPIDVITHLPILCEENSIPYVYVDSKEELGAASATKRPTSCVMIVHKKGVDYEELYDECHAAMTAVAPVF
eukprot:TRINITY_DN3038_c0_g1_i1.p2 TRINITY_DN3038_c0_g1~~TRINITY_DN3038_c0_g1_i1.p2  ORF type:complete len:129 (-),score=52.19 TRINITY_DN3038_c0_g1_i1:39-425(-)